MALTSKNGGKLASASDTSASQILKGIIYTGPRQLTESEIALLRQSKAEVSQRVKELYREADAVSRSSK